MRFLKILVCLSFLSLASGCTNYDQQHMENLLDESEKVNNQLIEDAQERNSEILNGE